MIINKNSLPFWKYHDPQNLSKIVNTQIVPCGYHLSMEMNPNRTRQCRIFIVLVKYATLNSELFKTSPPSAREAAMSAMQHETFLKHLESFLETSLEHP